MTEDYVTGYDSDGAPVLTTAVFVSDTRWSLGRDFVAISETLRMLMPPRAVESRGLHIIAPDFYQELGDSGYVVPWGIYCFASAEKVSTCALAQA